MSVAVDLGVCLNCGAPLAGHYCARCGQKAEAVNPTLGEFVHELAHEISHVDGRILRSTQMLLTQPGFLSREHFEGRRARWVSPIRVYLMFSLLFFAVSAFSPMAGMKVSCTKCPEETRAEREAMMREAIGHETPHAMFVLVPVFAGFVALVAWKSGRNYPQHLYFSMHVHSAWFVAGATAGAIRLLRVSAVDQAAASLAIVCAAVYLALALRRAYGIGWVRSIVGTVLVVATYWMVVLFAMLAIVLPVLYHTR
jgi:hypothetical protein